MTPLDAGLPGWTVSHGEAGTAFRSPAADGVVLVFPHEPVREPAPALARLASTLGVRLADLVVEQATDAVVSLTLADHGGRSLGVIADGTRMWPVLGAGAGAAALRQVLAALRRAQVRPYAHLVE